MNQSWWIFGLFVFGALNAIHAADPAGFDEVSIASSSQSPWIVEPIDAQEDQITDGAVSGMSHGPDVIVGELHNFNNYGTFGEVAVFSVGTTSCNIGDTPLSWVENTNQHPVIAQNMYRLSNGRFEHIGQSWLKHGFLALAENACGLGCQNPGTGALLGVGCSDPYSANLNGIQSNLGMKSEINAHTGFFTFPPADPAWTGPVARRLRTLTSDLDPAQNGGGQYFVEGHYVTPDDAMAGNQNNNASYREITITQGQNGNWNMAFADSTQREQAGIRAWKDNDPAVVETEIQIPNDGLLILAAKATHLGDGLWHYEYALQNLNSDRSVRSFQLRTPPEQKIQNIGFHDVDYHSGEPFDGSDWPALVDNGLLLWTTEAAASNPNANAIRWGTLYNFRFDIQAVPTNDSLITIGMFKPGTPQVIVVPGWGPATAPVDCNQNGRPDVCDLDCNGNNGLCNNFPGCGLSIDCDNSGQPDECESDCNDNGVFDSCDLEDGTSADCDANENPDECDPDWDGDDAPDACDPDIDSDGLLNGADICDFTPLGAPIRPNGTIVGDINNDCDIDLPDYAHFDNCILQSGPGQLPTTAPCLGLYDWFMDNDVDLMDFAAIENAFTGPGE